MLGIGEKRELPTILLIDDDLVSREVIATVLTLHGHLVHTADNGEEALNRCASWNLTVEAGSGDREVMDLDFVLRAQSERRRCRDLSSVAIRVVTIGVCHLPEAEHSS